MVQLAPEKWQASRAHVPSLPIHNQSVSCTSGWSDLSAAFLNSICDLSPHVYGGDVGFRFSVVDGSISLSYLRFLLLKMWE